MKEILTFTINPGDADDNIGTRWLSNFAPVKVKLDGMEFPNVEQAYQASKNTSKKWRSYCSAVKYPQTTKKLADPEILKYRDDWTDKLKVKIMRDLLVQKFNQEPYKQNLINTGVCHIEEGNYWNDKFWGVDINTREGKNILGQLIMDIRADLLKEKDNKSGDVTQKNF